MHGGEAVRAVSVQRGGLGADRVEERAARPWSLLRRGHGGPHGHEEDPREDDRAAADHAARRRAVIGVYTVWRIPAASVSGNGAASAPAASRRRAMAGAERSRPTTGIPSTAGPLAARVSGRRRPSVAGNPSKG